MQQLFHHIELPLALGSVGQYVDYLWDHIVILASQTVGLLMG